MKRYYTEQEIKALLKDLTIVIDTREQVNQHITQYFDSKGIACKSRKLDTGDYAAMLQDMTMETDVVIERKASIDELAGNMTVDRDRFEREFLRATANRIKVYLVIENGSWTDIQMHNYRSKLTPQSFQASLLSWMARFNVMVMFCKAQETGKLIHGILYYEAREALKRGI